MVEFKVYAGPSQSHTRNSVADVAHLGLVSFQILPSGRGIEKQMVHRNHGPFSGSDFRDLFDPSAFNDNSGAHIRGLGPGDNLHV